MWQALELRTQREKKMFVFLSRGPQLPSVIRILETILWSKSMDVRFSSTETAGKALHFFLNSGKYI